MRVLKLCLVGLATIIITVLSVSELGNASRWAKNPEQSAGVVSEIKTSHWIVLLSAGAATQRYTVDASQSKFIAHALSGGLLWFKGHDHLVAVREFTGEAQLTPESITNSSLQITAKTESKVETSSVFTDQQKQIINKELREIVLLPAQYPEIVFRSTNVSGKQNGSQYDLKITGDLTLHGVTRQITIPTKVTVTGNDLRAQGEFSVDRDDFKVKATSAF